MGLIAVEASRASLSVVDVGINENLVGRYFKVSFAFSHSAVVSYTHRSSFPKETAKPEKWQVGYIVNVLWENLRAYYGPQRTEHSYMFGGPILDKQPGPTPWYSLTPVDPVFPCYKEFTYGGGQGISRSGGSRSGGLGQRIIAHLKVVDTPTRIYLNEYRSEFRGRQLREIKDTIMFGVWIAARSLVSKVGSYNILLALRVEVPIEITISGDRWPVTRTDGAGGLITPAQGEIRYSGKPEFKKGPAGKPEVSGPIANDLLVAELVESGMVYSGPHMPDR